MEDHVKQALEIVKAQASVRNMTEEEINSMIKSLSEGIQKASQGAAEEQVSEEQHPAVDPKKAIREKSIICLECGKSFKVITKKHLAKHDMTPEEYKEKWGYKKNQSLVAKSLARERRKKMQEMELWKKREIKMPGR
ncbi:transcriptional regulator, MucR family [Desulfonatronospira thiodismutans ASO3-1]|uniref:Transcriptional regulator, MucR family n=1 Tax=Desulfonatronospira thiodismutans ASO3-1 TaxID=555779 RepID=D6SSV7_9BACT|nr:MULTISPECIES: MucR family transcriptional regulator [Desulfonatronospira]EFI33773.1 transcriptional regulator, MucR family [Desulfonatronospira thiodismutans ASO3-1]RQD78168.1 MAG: transcriptional regulator [Desulfonatronospira sp. MSAO_Bac3]